MKLRTLLILLPLFTPVRSDTLTLAGAVELGIEHNFSIRIGKVDEQKSENNKRLKTGALLPVLRLDAAGTKTATHYFSSTPPGAQLSVNELRAGAVLNWTLFDGFRMFHAAHQIDLQADLAQTATRHQIEAAVASIVTAYYDLIAKRSLLNTAREQLSLSREHLKFVVSQYAYGRIGRRELLSQEVVFNSDSSALLAQMLAEKTALHTLNLAIGRAPDFLFECSADTLPDSLINTPEWWYEEALKHNSSLQMAHLQKLLTVTRHALATSAFRPVVAANGSAYGYSQNSNDFFRSQVGISISLPLLNGFSTTTAVRNSVLDTLSADLSVEEAKLALQAHIYEQFDRLSISIIQVQFEQTAIQRAQESLALSEEQFRLGRISDVTLRESQLALLQAQVRYQTALFQNRIVAVQLEQLAGKLTIPQ